VLTTKNSGQLVGPVTINDVGSFTIRVQNGSSGTLSNGATLPVNAASLSISNISPTTVLTGQFSLTINGTAFDPATARIVITGPNCPTNTSCVVPNNVLTTKNSGQLVGPVTINDAGSFTIRVQNGSAGTLSNGATLTVNTASTTPTISVTPSSGPQLTTNFITNGSGFSPGGQIRQLLTFPGQSTPQEISQLTANGLGGFSSTYTTKCSDNPGVYTLYMIDVATNSQSNSITQTVTASAGCNAPTLSIAPPSAAQGSSFQITGNNYSQNGQVRRFTVFPNGVTYELPGAVASGSGQIGITVPTNCGTAVGSYTTYMLDVASNKESTRASYQVNAGSSCSSAVSLFVAPASATLGTAFTFTGSGFKPNSTVTLSVTRGDGQPGNGAQYNTDSNGGVSFVVSSLSTDPLGQWTFRVTDTLGNLASTTAQYTALQPAGTDLLHYTASTIDVTIPDLTQFTPGQTKNKIWRIQNSGTNTWNNYRLVYVPGIVNGNTSSNLSSVTMLTINANPGQWIDTPALPITAPNASGIFHSYWQMQNSNGQNFGTRIYVKIRVVPQQSNALGYGTESGRNGSNDSPSGKSGKNADPVDTATGNYNFTATDLRVPGRGLDVELARSYNSQDATPGPLGHGWSHSFNIYLTNITSSSASLHYSDGKVLDYINQAGTTTFTSSYPGYYDSLVRNGDATWTLKKTDQRNYQFDSSGRLTAIQDRNNNQLSLSYSGSNLSQVTDTVGRTFTFGYSGSLLTGITDPGGRNLQFSYDGNSNLISFRDANGNTNTYNYDSGSRLLKIVDGRGNELLTNTYDVNNRVVTQKNGRGNQWTFVYNADGSTSVLDPLNKETRYVQDTNFNLQQTHDRNANTQFASGGVNLAYDENNNRAQVSDANGNYASYVHDQKGNVVSQTDPTLNSRQAVYDSKNNPTQLTDELGKITQITYDSNGNLTTMTNALSNSASTTYNSFGQPISVTDANGHVTTQTYDSQGNLSSVKDALNNTTTYSYDGIGRRTRITDARGKITNYTYDANDNVLTVTDPLNNVTTYTYDANNNRISVRDPRGQTTTYTYDENNSLLKETDAKGNFIQHTYDKLDRRISTRDRRGYVTNFTYDNEGRLLTVVDPLGNTTSYSYDANGNRTKITDAKSQSTTFTYDALNRVIRIQDALGNTIQNEFDAAGRLKKETDPRGNATQFTYDAVGNLTQVNDAAAGTAKYSYDKSRNRITQTDPNNRTSSLAYDKLNRLLATTDPLNQTATNIYDGVGNRTSQTDAKGQTTTYTYDANNRLSIITYSNNSTVQFTRDANGNITRMVDSLGTSNYVYDELNRLTSSIDPFAKTIGYQYDANGNISKLTYPDGKQVTYQYDGNNRMTSLSDWAVKTTSFQYDNTNLLTRVTYPNGIISLMTYDSAGRLIAKSDSGISSYTFTLDKNGNRTNASITQPLSNRPQNTSQSYTYDAANRIQNAGGATFGFDANGNMTSKTEAGVTTNYGYDFENRLVSVNSSVQYFYSGQGVRLQKIESTTTTRYVVDVNNKLSQVLCETNANGAITASYVYALGLAYKVNPDGTHYYYHFDPMGSTVAVTDDAKKIVNSYAYDPFGLVTNSVEGTPNPFQFIGQLGVARDSEDLSFMRARFYLPRFGRFTNKDLADADFRNPQTLNQFPYAANNPISFADPKGLLFEYGGFFYNLTNFVDSRVSQTTIQVLKTVPDFAACAGTGGRITQACYGAGYDDLGIAILKYFSKQSAGLILGPKAKYILEGIDTAQQAGEYLEVAERIFRGELTTSQAIGEVRRALIDLIGTKYGYDAGIMNAFVDNVTQKIVQTLFEVKMNSIRTERVPGNTFQPRGPQPVNPVGKPPKN